MGHCHGTQMAAASEAPESEMESGCEQPRSWQVKCLYPSTRVGSPPPGPPTKSAHWAYTQRYIASLMRGDDTTMVARQHQLLEERQNSAAQLGVHMYGFRVILQNTLQLRIWIQSSTSSFFEVKDSYNSLLMTETCSLE